MPKAEYFTVQDITPAGNRTAVWRVVANSDGAVLGHLRWFGRWRQFTFHPAPNTVFSVGCLFDLISQLGAMDAARSHARAAARQRQRERTR